MTIAAHALPPCASCGERTDASRVIGDVRKGGDDWIAFTACAACLAVTGTTWIGGMKPLSPVLIAPGSAIARLRETLRRAAESDTIRREVGRILTTPDQALLAGVPELFPELRLGIGKRHRLRTNVEVALPHESRPVVLGVGVPTSTPWNGPMNIQMQRTAITGNGPGGLVDYYGRFVLLVQTRRAVTGVCGGHLLVEIPEWAAKGIRSPRILVPWGLTARDEEI